MEKYKLSSDINGHKLDVRCITTFRSGSEVREGLISGSRDNTARLWTESDTGKWQPGTVFEGHPRYVSSVVFREPDEQFDQGLIYTGCLDGTIRAYEPKNSNPHHELEGHSGAVSCIFITPSKTLLSSSWDKTARVWLNDKPITLLKGHEGAVWCVAIFPEANIIVTGSADYSIKLWKGGHCKYTISDVHTQAVRNVGVLSNDRMVSCSNDGQIILWEVKERDDKLTACVVRKFMDSDYVYSLSVFPNSSCKGWVSSGENTGIKVFGKDGAIQQRIDVPAQSVWCVTVLANGDIAAGCSDHHIYVFSNDEKRIADSERLRLYDAQVENLQSQLSVNADSSGSNLPDEIGGVKVSDMPSGPDALTIPGKRDGQTKMVKWPKESKITAHTWSEDERKWVLIGDVISNSNVRVGKAMYDGKEYDYVFDIDVGDGIPPLKLPYNNSQDPYHVAQDFINKNELPQSYLDEIAKFIYKNSSHKVPSNTTKVSDPFTGNGAYVSESTPRAPHYTESFSDPFTGSSSYSSQSKVLAEDQEVYFPKKTYLPFVQIPNMEALSKKLKQLNDSIPKDALVQDSELQSLVSIYKSDNVTYDDIQLIFKVMRWPLIVEGITFNPMLDIVRLAFINPPKHGLASEILESNQSTQEFIGILKECCKESKRPINQMLAIKIFSNMFLCKNGVEHMYAIKEQVLELAGNLISSDNKNCQIAVATLILNYAVASTNFIVQPELQKQCLTLSSLLIIGLSDPEAKYRTLIAIGTLIESSDSNLVYAKEIDMKQNVNSAMLIVQADHKIHKVAKFIQLKL